MKAQDINPFIESVSQLFITMLDCEVKRSDAKLAHEGAKSSGLTGVIGISGHIRGNVSIAFPKQTALAIISKLMRLEEVKTEIDVEVSDGVSEIINIIAGGAKSRMATDDDTDPLSLSLPNIIYGDKYDVYSPSNSKWIEVPFTSELGDFTLSISYEYKKH
jgi:chemotaxis protein CheX